jgi:hypothetical protein
MGRKLSLVLLALNLLTLGWSQWVDRNDPEWAVHPTSAARNPPLEAVENAQPDAPGDPPCATDTSIENPASEPCKAPTPALPAESVTDIIPAP